jgi:hypothetical protein
MSQAQITKTIDIDLSGYRFEANGQVFEIEAGHLKTDYMDNASVQWDWQIGLELKKADFIPFNKPSYLLYPDGSVFVRTRVLKREKQGNLSVLTLVPWIEE